MAYIANSDGTVGNIISANKYMMDDNLQAKYRLLKSLSDTRKKIKIEPDTTGPNIANFLTKLQLFYFSPPSDNLWTIHFDNVNLQKFIENIRFQNKIWDNLVGTAWTIDTGPAEIKGNPISKVYYGPNQYSYTPANENDYVSHFSGSSGLFLAQDVNFTPLSVNVTNEPWNQGINARSFLNFGMAAHGRVDNKSLKVSFLISNWDIGDLLIDPWIAAIAQRGLIEDENSSIKTNITLKEYSSSLPKDYNNGEPIKEMKCRKQYTFHNCFPVSRGQISKSYEPNDAGTFKKTIVDFRYDDYSIHYFY